MTYYQIKFVDSHGIAVSKVFRTQEQAKQHAKRVLGIVGEGGPDPKIAITPVERKQK